MTRLYTAIIASTYYGIAFLQYVDLGLKILVGLVTLYFLFKKNKNGDK